VPIEYPKNKRIRRDDSLQKLQDVRAARDDLVRTLIVDDGRVDILAEEVGYRFDDFHLALDDFQNEHKNTLQLAPRGWGKSTAGNILKNAVRIIQNRNIRILLASETSTQACNFLSEIKGILTHPRVVELFGDLKGDVWHENAINVAGRTKAGKEKTVTTAGVDGNLTSGHFDIICPDDLVTLKNSRTAFSREKIVEWFYTTLLPCVTDETTEFHILGTRYHPEDLYGHMIKNDPKFKKTTQLIPAFNPDTEKSNNPKIFSTEWLTEQRDSMGRIYFNSQYNQDPSGVQGVIFDEDDFKWVGELPPNLIKFQGVDLAVGTKTQNDKFAMVTIGVDPKNRRIYVVDYYTGKVTLKRQDEIIAQRCETAEPVAVGIEANAFQISKIISLKDDPRYSFIPALPVYTDKDKMTRAQMLQVRFERGEIYFQNAERQGELMEHLMAFPNGRYDDLFDALDIAIRTAFQVRKRKKKKRTKEPGIIRPGKRTGGSRWVAQ